MSEEIPPLEDGKVIVGARTGSLARGTKVYHTDSDCQQVPQIPPERRRRPDRDDVAMLDECTYCAEEYDANDGGDESHRNALLEADPDDYPSEGSA